MRFLLAALVMVVFVTSVRADWAHKLDPVATLEPHGADGDDPDIYDIDDDDPQNVAYQFGASLAGGREWLLVGDSSRVDGRLSPNVAHFFRFDEAGRLWSASQMASSGVYGEDGFGSAVAIAEPWAAVGAPRDAGNTGAVHLYRLNDGEWKPVIKLAGEAADDMFGYAVAMDGDTLAVGAIGREAGKYRNCGVVYLFRLEDEAWKPAGQVTPADPANGDNFGAAIAIKGQTMLIGAPGRQRQSGMAYRFEALNGQWKQAAKLSADGLQRDDRFGAAVALGEHAVVGSRRAAWIFSPDGQRLKLDTPADTLATAGDMVLAGGGGRTLVFRRLNGRWAMTQPLRGGRVTVAAGQVIVADPRTSDATAYAPATAAPPVPAEGLALWLDARSIETNLVAEWFDQSYNGRSVTQADADRKSKQIPNIGMPTVSFEGGRSLDLPELLPAGGQVFTLGRSKAGERFQITLADTPVSSISGFEIAELLVYTRRVSAEERAVIERYLSDKWLRPTFTRRSLHAPSFRAGQKDLVLTNWHLSAGDLNSRPQQISYTLVTVPANGVIAKNGHRLKTGSVFTQADVDRGVITFTHTGRPTDSHAAFSFTLAGATGGSGQTHEVVLIRLNETATHKLFAHAADKVNWDDEALADFARNLRYGNVKFTEQQLAKINRTPGNVFNLFCYSNSTTTNSRWDAVRAEQHFRRKFGIMMTPVAQLDGPIDAKTTQIKLKPREGFTLSIVASGTDANVSPVAFQNRDCVYWIRVGDELMKVTAWDPKSMTATVVRGFDHVPGDSLCTPPTTHADSANVYGPLYLDLVPRTDAGKNSRIRYIMDFTELAGRQWHGYTIAESIAAARKATGIADYVPAIWWDTFGAVNVGGSVYNPATGKAVSAPKWNTNRPTGPGDEPLDTRINAEVQYKYQQLKIHDAKHFAAQRHPELPGLADYHPPRPEQIILVGNNLRTDYQRKFMLSCEENRHTPADGMFIEHMEVRQRYWLVRSMLSTEPGVPPGGMAIFCKNVKYGSLEDPRRDAWERAQYSGFLLGINRNSNCYYGISPTIRDPRRNGRIGVIPDYFFYPIGQPVKDYDANSMTIQSNTRSTTFPSQYWPGTKVEHRVYENGIVFHNFGGLPTTIDLPPYIGPDGRETNAYIDTRKGQIVRQWHTSGFQDSNIFLKLRN